jgi:hypothetical protein
MRKENEEILRRKQNLGTWARWRRETAELAVASSKAAVDNLTGYIHAADLRALKGDYEKVVEARDVAKAEVEADKEYLSCMEIKQQDDQIRVQAGEKKLKDLEKERKKVVRKLKRTS